MYEDDVVVLSDDDEFLSMKANIVPDTKISSTAALSDSDDDFFQKRFMDLKQDDDDCKSSSSASEDEVNDQHLSQNSLREFHPMSESDGDEEPRPVVNVPVLEEPESKASKKPTKKRRGKYTEEEKTAMEAEKQAKKLQKEEMRRKRPEHCLKYIILEVDRDLVQIPALEQVLNFAPIEQCRSEVKSRDVPFTIRWHRELAPDQNGHCSREWAPAMMQLLEMSMVEPLVRDGELVSHLRSVLRSNRGVDKFNVLIYGRNQYFALKKKGNGRISKEELEEATVECQLELGISFCHAETAQEVSEWLFRFTKAVAQEPFKKMKRDWQNNFRFHLASEKSNGIRDDFSKIWLKSLKKFKRMPLETCQAIAAIYQSPAALIEAYDQCESSVDAKLLLEDIAVQRGVGVLATERRVGPALSRRIHTVLTSFQPDLLLNDVE